MKGVAHVDHLDVIRWAYTTPSNSSTHFPFAHSNIFLMHSMGFCLSPLLVYCFVDNKGVEYKFLMSSFEQNVRKTVLSNWGPLFITIARGILNRHMMFFQMNLETSLSLILT